jgi:hypothetical protein
MFTGGLVGWGDNPSFAAIREHYGGYKNAGSNFFRPEMECWGSLRSPPTFV